MQRTLDAIVELGLADADLSATAADLREQVNRVPADPEGARALADRLTEEIVARLRAPTVG